MVLHRVVLRRGAYDVPGCIGLVQAIEGTTGHGVAARIHPRQRERRIYQGLALAVAAVEVDPPRPIAAFAAQ